MNDDKPKPTLDERIQALTESGQLVFEMLKDTIANMDRMTEEIRAADKRERKARAAILTGIAAYLRALDNGEEGRQ